jgi:hypothetical protein
MDKKTSPVVEQSHFSTNKCSGSESVSVCPPGYLSVSQPFCPLKSTSSTSKHEISLLNLFLCAMFVRIRIQPTKINAIRIQTPGLN